MKPKVPIIISCYKTEKTLPGALQSVLEQYFNDCEALIIDDVSLNNLEAIANQWMRNDARFKYF